MDKIFKARPSKWIMGMYWIMPIFLMLTTVLAYPLIYENMLSYYVMSLFLSIVSLLFIFIIFRAYRMRFILKKDQLIIKGIFWEWTLDRKNIKSAKKTLIPLGMRLFGTSFLGGLYYIPTIGRVRVAMVNFEDGVIIETKEGKHYLITPEKPHEFIKAVK